jgi:ATP-dependent Lon protease
MAIKDDKKTIKPRIKTKKIKADIIDVVDIVNVLMKKKQGVVDGDTEKYDKIIKAEIGKKKVKDLDWLPVVPLRDIVVYPNTVSPLFIGREKSIHSVTNAMQKGRKVFIVVQKDSTVGDIDIKNLNNIGVVGTIIQCIRLPDDTFKLLVDANYRAESLEYQDNGIQILAKLKKLETIDSDEHQTKAIMRQILLSLTEYAKLNKRIDESSITYIEDIKEPHLFCDTAVSYLPLEHKIKQDMLGILVASDRLEKLYAHILDEIDILKAEKTVQDRVKENMDKNHKEYYLHEQIKAIKKELGEKDGNTEAVDKYANLLKTLKLSKEAYDKADEEIKRLATVSASSSEHIRSYLDWLFAVPWQVLSDKNTVTIDTAEKILNTTHYGLDKVKEVILEYIAVQMNTTKTRSAILCLYGPPGVGKTSLVKSIAESMGRKYVKIALGGVRDEAEIRGHRRTYIGALPGKIIQAMKKAGTSDPIILLDEIDKLNSDHRGDPSSALLEALDPEQNNEFNDHYLEVGYDLSNVMFIATANSLSMQRPLLDRLEIIKVPSYLEHEKLEICKRHILSKQLELIGLPTTSIVFKDDAIKDIIEHYTRESGVRELERLVAKIIRKNLIKMMKNGSIIKPATIIEPEKIEGHIVQASSLAKMEPAILSPDFKTLQITSKIVERDLGAKKYIDNEFEKQDQVGVTNGLAYTEVGGDVLTIEAVKTPATKGEIKITGKLGDVMKESAQAAFSHVSANYAKYGIKLHDLNSHNIHVHVPDGATPKDGPSAGAAMTTTIISLFTGIPVRHDLAMTGEITLRGKVLPIGGLREKMTAAIRLGMKVICIPKENNKDLEEVPDYVKKACEIVLCDTIDDVLKHALIKKIKPLSKLEIDEMLNKMNSRIS